MSTPLDPRSPAAPPGDSGASGCEALPEGEEAPPRGVRAMAVVRWAIVVLMAFVAAGAWVYTGTRQRARVAVAQARFHCPMHPTVLSERPGSCPICGMDLVAVEQSRPPPASAAPTTYWCPMHPEVTSTDPDARCEKCGGMKLLPRTEASPRGERVPGTAELELSPDRTRLVGMRTAKAKRATLRRELRTIGFVVPDERRLATIATRTSGWIDRLDVVQAKPFVRKGELLATLYNPDLRQRQLGYVGAVRFGSTGAAPAPGGEGRTILAEAREQLAQLGFADADLDRIAKTLQPLPAIPIRAPLAGHVIRMSATSGTWVESGTQIFQIADLSTVWVVAEVYEDDVGQVRVGQGVRVTVAAWPHATFSGRVQYLYPTVNPATRTMQVRAELANPGLKLRPGMQGDVFLDVSGAEAIVVPADAVVDTGDVQYVLVARGGGRFEPRRVQIGARGDEGVELASGVQEGEAVVTAANFLIDSESRLRAAIEDLAATDGADAATTPAATAHR